MIGGFSATSIQTDSSGRDLVANKTTLSAVALLPPKSGGELSVLDGFTLVGNSSLFNTSLVQSGSAHTLRFNKTNLNGLILTYAPVNLEGQSVRFNLEFNSCNVTGGTGVAWDIKLSGNLSLTDCTFSGNGGFSVLNASMSSPSQVYIKGSNFTDDILENYYMMEFPGTAHVTFEKSTLKGGIIEKVSVDPAFLTVIP